MQLSTDRIFAMNSVAIGPVTIHAEVVQAPLTAPFRIAGYTFDALDTVVVSMEKDGCVGLGEAVGVYYKGDNAAAMTAQIEQIRGTIEAGCDRQSLQGLLPPCGARNALDCALWDLEAKLFRTFVWKMAKLAEPLPLLTTFTCGADEPEKMADTARRYASARAIKLKLTGEPADADRVEAVRDARPDVWLGIDANQGFSRPFLEQLIPVLMKCRVQLIEQPFAVGQEVLLDGLRSPIPIAADESVQCLDDLPHLVGRFDVVNIKLDKCGGLTEGFAMVRAARELGLATMVGNMMGTSLAMAPAFVLGQLCSIVDLDGPIFLKADRPMHVTYDDGFIFCPQTLWG
jgi:L-alanine-DL-glutamate epimerase-like enolase superfamily enzyme